MRERQLLVVGAALAFVVTVALLGGRVALAKPGPFDPSRFSTRIDNPYVPFSLVRSSTLAGTERDSKTGETVDVRSDSRLLPRIARIAGVRVAVVDVKEYEDGELVEHTLDYYAQRDDGSVWYFGERVDEYEDGKIVGHEGQWYAGRGKAKPGLFMPARPRVGQTFEQERAPGVAEDRSTVVAVDLTTRTPAGRLRNCIKTRDVAPLDKSSQFKFYCRGVGLVREQSPRALIELTRYR
jgi:hypothetical protein